MSYAALTYNDPNRLKSWLQRRRLRDALRISCAGLGRDWTGSILDFGGGDGALARAVREHLPRARVLCYEPSDRIFAEATAASSGIDVVQHLDALNGERFDVVTCCEVLNTFRTTSLGTASRKWRVCSKARGALSSACRTSST